MAGNDVKISYRSGTSYARGMTIDGWLETAEVEMLYEKWLKEWPAPLEVQGGVKIITCEMVKKIDPRAIRKVYGRKLGSKLIEVSERQAVLS